MQLMKPVLVPVEQIYVPMSLRKTLDTAKVQSLAESILERGLTTPIHVRRDEKRYVLVTGLHRLEALKLLGETTVQALIVQARQR
ncbi:MAG: chromosome partitioning protein ParB [Alphaproteobacteria bacterium]|nr:chromosome partitioning protein ParB [Alphaproteobacteria bacterium]